MASINGTSVTFSDTASPVSQAVTIPAGTNCVVLTISGFRGDANWLPASNFTIGGATFVQAVTTANQTAREQGWIWYALNPATGPQTLAGSWTGSAPGEGLSFAVHFLAGVNTTTPTKDPRTAAATGAQTFSALNSVTGDISLALRAAYDMFGAITGGTQLSRSNTSSVAHNETNAGAAVTSFSSTLAEYDTFLAVVFANEGASDTTPDAFSFTDQTNVARSTVLESNDITVAGINAAAAISITGGEYRINGGSWVSTAGTVNNGDVVRVRHTSSASFSTATNTVLTIGGVSDTFTTTTVAQDTTPNAFTFTDQTDVPRSSIRTSNAITVAGINSAASISITGGDYSINGGGYTSGAGTVNNGDQVTVRHTSSASYSTAVNTVLTIGGVSDTFTSTTEAAPAGPAVGVRRLTARVG